MPMLTYMAMHVREGEEATPPMIFLLVVSIVALICAVAFCVYDTWKER